MLEDELWIRQRDKPSHKLLKSVFGNWAAETEFSVFFNFEVSLVSFGFYRAMH